MRPSNPRVMTRVLEAVNQLSEEKGASVRDIFDFVRKTSKNSARNLAMQVQRALKHGVNAGILRHRNGRYKALIALSVPAVKEDTKNTRQTPKPKQSANTSDSKVQDKDVKGKRDVGNRKYKRPASGRGRSESSRKSRNGRNEENVIEDTRRKRTSEDDWFQNYKRKRTQLKELKELQESCSFDSEKDHSDDQYESNTQLEKRADQKSPSRGSQQHSEQDSKCEIEVQKQTNESQEPTDTGSGSSL